MLALDQGHARAQRAVGLAELDADHSAAHHDEARRNDLRGRRVPVRPGTRVGETIDRRKRRRGAAGQDHGAAHLDRLVTADHPLLAVQAAPAAQQCDAAFLEPRQLGAVVEVVDDLVATPQHGARVERTGHGLRRSGHPAHLGEQLAGPQKPLGRHARPVGAFPSDLAVLDDRDVKPCLGEPPRRDLATGPRAQHNHVEAPHPPRLPHRAFQAALMVRGGAAPSTSAVMSRTASARVRRPPATSECQVPKSIA